MGVKLSDRFSEEGAAEVGAVRARSGEAAGRQLELLADGDAELFRGVGVEELPVGLSELTTKQRGFVLAYLKTGNAAAAARAAGVNESNSSKMLKKPGVVRLLNAVVAQVAASGDQLVRRQWELSVSLHEELQSIRAKPLGDRTGDEQRREWQLIKSINQTNTLLAALLNRLGVRLSGELTTTQNINVSASGVAVEAGLLDAFFAGRAAVDGAVGAPDLVVGAGAGEGVAA